MIEAEKKMFKLKYQWSKEQNNISQKKNDISLKINSNNAKEPPHE